MTALFKKTAIPEPEKLSARNACAIAAGRRVTGGRLRWMAIVAAAGLFACVPASAGRAAGVHETRACSESDLQKYLDLFDRMLSAERIDAFAVNKELKAGTPVCKVDLEELSRLAKRSRYFHSMDSDNRIAKFTFIRKDEKHDFEAGFNVDNTSGLIFLPYGIHKNFL